jgi:hypothetical protein
LKIGHSYYFVSSRGSIEYENKFFLKRVSTTQPFSSAETIKE